MSRKLALLLLPTALAVGATTASPSAETGPRPSAFVRRVDNPWFPLRPGTTYVYRGVKDGTPSRDVVTVSAQTNTIQGIRCVVVRDRLYLAGTLRERTTDWYAQDRAGNVWYFGEATAELDASGKVTTTEGSWQAGIRGARAGIVMPARPRVGQRFRQEYLKGHAEDQFEVLSLSARVVTPAASSRRALLTKEWTRLEPGVIDQKLYVRGIGQVAERMVRGGDERAVLQSVTRR